MEEEIHEKNKWGKIKKLSAEQTALKEVYRNSNNHGADIQWYRGVLDKQRKMNYMTPVGNT